MKEGLQILLLGILFQRLGSAYFVTYCIQYLHAMPFLWNKMSYFLLKIPKMHAV